MASEFFEVKSTSNKSTISKLSNKESKTSNKDNKASNKLTKLSNLKDKKQLSNDNNGFVELKINNKKESKTTSKSTKQKTYSQTFNYLNKDVKQEGNKTQNNTKKCVDMSLKRKRTVLDTNIKSENSKSKSKSNKLFNGTNAKNKIAITGSSLNHSPTQTQTNVVASVSSSDKLIETMSRS